MFASTPRFRVGELAADGRADDRIVERFPPCVDAHTHQNLQTRLQLDQKYILSPVHVPPRCPTRVRATTAA